MYSAQYLRRFWHVRKAFTSARLLNALQGFHIEKKTRAIISVAQFAITSVTPNKS